jgi:hypothetical protein
MLAAALCTSVGEKEKVVQIPIERLDLAGAELTFEDYLNPQFANDYPAVVATVNGEEITGEALVRQQVSLELSRRSVLENLENMPQFFQEQLEDIEATDPLESLIDDELERQAIERLGLLPTYDEAVVYTDEAEAAFYDAGDGASDGREAALNMMRLQGLPTTNWASSEQLVEAYRRGAGKASLLQEVCRSPTPEMGFLNVTNTRDCSDFLAEEREDADIVYYVRWADE